MTDRELMQQALDALEKHVLEYETVEALRARLAQPEQEHSEQWWKHEVSNAWAEGYEKGRLQREWQGLTDEEIMNLIHDVRWQNMVVTTDYLARAIEAKLKEKNHAV